MSTTRRITHQYAPAISWTCIGRPDDSCKTLVDEQGALLYDFINWRASTQSFFFRRVFSFGLLYGQPVSITQSTETARHPFVRTVIAYPDATLELTAFAHEHEGKRSDIVLWKISAEKELDTALWIDGQSLAEVFILKNDEIPDQRIYSIKAHQWQHLSVEFSVESQYAVQAAPLDSEPELAFISASYVLEPAHGRHYGPTPRYLTPIVTLTPDQAVEGAFVFPLNHSAEGDYDLAWAQQALIDERKFWNDYPLQPLKWQIPDPDVMDMLTACARNILQAREVHDGQTEFQVGPTCYRGLWVTDGHFILEAARYLGYERASDQGINALLRRVKSDGSITQFPFHIKETGISIATFVRQCELDDDWDRLTSMWSVIQNAVQHIRTLREASRSRGETALEYNLMPPAFADGGLGGERPEYTTALWTLVGLKEATRAARILNFEEDAASFQAEFDDLMAVLREKAARDTQVLPDGTKYLPMAMPGGGSEHRDDAAFDGELSDYLRIKPGTGNWALAHAIYPGQIFPFDDPMVQQFCAFLDLMDDAEGIPAYTGWLVKNSLWNYGASFYAHVWLYAGRPEKAIDYLYAFADHATPTRVWREEQNLRHTDFEQLWGDMPHNWSSAEFIRLVRNLLVFERGDDLDLLAGLAPEWTRPGAVVRLEASPTCFGPVTLDLIFDDQGEATLTLRFDTTRTQQPAQIRLFMPAGLTHIQHEGQQAVSVQGSSATIPFVDHQLIRLLR